MKDLSRVAALTALIALMTACAALQGTGPAPAPTAAIPSPAHVRPAEEQSFQSDAIRSWQLQREMLGVTQEALEHALEADLPVARQRAPVVAGGCEYSLIGRPVIKGKAMGGRKVYFIPPQAFYGRVLIDEGAGDAWLCAEAQAQQDGWQPSTWP